MPAARTPLLTRRQGLTAAVLLGPVALMAACGSDDTAEAPTAAPERPAPALDATVAADEAQLIAHYDAVLASLPEGDSAVRATLLLIRDQHAEHREALGGGSADEPVVLPDQPSISSLMAAEKSAAKSRIRSCVEATDPELARVLTFIAASEASHVPALKDLV